MDVSLQGAHFDGKESRSNEQTTSRETRERIGQDSSGNEKPVMIDRDDVVDEAEWESFPASDPPAWTLGDG